MKVIIIQPPLVQLNTAYPSGAYLSSFFKKLGHEVKWYDFSIKLFHKIFSKDGLTKLFNLTQNKALKLAQTARTSGDENTFSNLMSYLSQSQAWINWIDLIVNILTDGTNYSTRELCHRFIFSPDAPRGMRMNNYLENLNHEASVDDARFLATMALADIADYITAVFDKEFALIRYGESITVSETSFSQIEKGLSSPILTEFYKEVLEDVFNPTSGLHPLVSESANQKTLVCITVPFAGTFSAALYTGKYLKSAFGDILFICAGGGFINTELRDCNERSLANYFDALSYDRGYGSYIDLLSSSFLNTAASQKTTECSSIKTSENPKNKPDTAVSAITNDRKFYKLKLFTLNQIYEHTDVNPDLQKLEDEYTASLTPDFTDIDFSEYPRVCDDINPMQRMWSDGTWIKAYLAHGCYWHRCAFCDTTLDYVKAYKPTKIQPLYESLKNQCMEKNVYGIHFVDEALPPKALTEFALLNMSEGNQLSFWGNVRFEKVYSRDMADFLSYGGLLGVSGGIEIATGTGLNEINKGTDLNSIVSACCAFKEAGILVHAYMIYGYWQQGDLDTINSMETLRQLYAAGLLDSSFWHKFVLTRHSGIYSEWQQGLHPELKPIEIKNAGIFAKNGLHFEGENKSEKFGRGLNIALQHWMHGEGLNKNVGKWFDFKTPQPNIPSDLIEKAIALYEKKRDENFAQPVNPDKAFWLGGKLLTMNNTLIWNYKGELFEERIPSEQKTISKILWQLNPSSENREKAVSQLKDVIQKNPQIQKLIKKFRGRGLCVL